MGRDIAREFKSRYPAMFVDYVRRCERGEVRPGFPYLWEDDFVQILNFPTKRHWREDSRLADIDDVLRFLAASYSSMGIATLAMPPLGCGNGKLVWEDVKELLETHLGSVSLEVFVYAPASSHAHPVFSGVSSHNPQAS
jgi:hypothetical protein